MLKFITKKMYFEAVKAGAEEDLRKGVFPWHLKSVQDAVVMDRIKNSEGLKIAEIGGGDTRILPTLARKNKVYNIEKFEGDHGGPDEKLTFDEVENIYAWVGDTDDLIEDNTFDLIFSVSVVEHIPTENLTSFMVDCARILKPGGLMIHAVDSYLPDEDYVHNGGKYLNFVSRRMGLHRSVFSSGLLEPLEPIEIKDSDDLRFRCQYVSNPDNMMLIWNQVAPNLRALRENSQSTAFLWAGKKSL